ncbi:MAG: tyrosine-type recombinase/integrase [candidate division NC10 bacterium]|nr:tyrosine-type recombinase/integrase [candidate division NC10 bacterium]
MAKAGLRRLTLHSLRHTYASLLLKRGEFVVHVKEQLGHSSIQVTVDMYGHGPWGAPGGGRSPR